MALTVDVLRQELLRFKNQQLNEEFRALSEQLQEATEAWSQGRPVASVAMSSGSRSRSRDAAAPAAASQQPREKLPDLLDLLPYEENAPLLPLRPVTESQDEDDDDGGSEGRDRELEDAMLLNTFQPAINWAVKRKGFNEEIRQMENQRAKDKQRRRASMMGFAPGLHMPLARDSDEEVHLPLGATKAPQASDVDEPELILEEREELVHQLGNEENNDLESVVETGRYEAFSTAVIIANVVLVGLETDYMARHWTRKLPIYFTIADYVFCVAAVIDYITRLCAVGIHEYFTGEDEWHWNVLDTVATVGQVLEEISSLAISGWHSWSGTGRLVVLLRLFRPVRTLLTMRSAHSVSALRTLVLSILEPLSSLTWVMVLLLIQTFLVGIPLTQWATNYKLSNTDEDVDENLEEFYGTLDRTMLALYETLSEGIHWGDVKTPLEKVCTVWAAPVFVLYSGFSLYAMMNVVTGIFVESALSTAEEERKMHLLMQMKQLFIELDEDGSGAVTEDEFTNQMKDERMLSFFKAIDLVPSDAAQLFNMLDADGSGELDPDELITGCVRLTGNAKALELAAFMDQFTREAARWRIHFMQLHQCVSSVLEKVDTLTTAHYSLSAAKGGRPSSEDPSTMRSQTHRFRRNVKQMTHMKDPKW
eukprot:TRINITY_DN122659_c0_g1_i1.p1 TRINITY_DN122659_c0_g1~~TRINITY_DN122659_c0_g1_i1.p1  ORF type:complete len:649 (+),score=193.29 TRINITY_DN122659_c0_g1_i1:180-2126(+)